MAGGGEILQDSQLRECRENAGPGCHQPTGGAFTSGRIVSLLSPGCEKCGRPCAAPARGGQEGSWELPPWQMGCFATRK